MANYIQKFVRAMHGQFAAVGKFENYPQKRSRFIQMSGNVYKILVLGQAGVGKTTFVHRCRTGQFEQKYIPTMSIETKLHNHTGPQRTLSFDFWDFAGSERYGVAQYLSFGSADAALIFTEINSLALSTNLSMQIAEQYLSEVRQYTTKIPIILVINAKMNNPTQIKVETETIFAKFSALVDGIHVISVESGVGCHEILNAVSLALLN